MSLLLALLAPADAAIVAVIVTDQNYYAEYDTQSRNLRNVGPLGFDPGLGALAYDRYHDRLLYFDDRSLGLWEIDRATGFASYVGYPGFPASAAAFTKEGILIAGDGTGWYEVDPYTGRASLRDSFGIVPNGGAWYPELEAVVYNRMGNTDFYAYNPFFGTHESLGGTPNFVNNAGMAWVPHLQSFLMFDFAGSIWTVSPSAGYSTFVTYFGTPGMVAATLVEGFGGEMWLSRLAGACGGPETFLIEHTGLNSTIAFAGGERWQAYTIPSGPCAGTVIPLGNPRLLHMAGAGGDGDAEWTVDVPLQACGKGIVAVDLGNCEVSNVAVP
jgi:hypothetical protein